MPYFFLFYAKENLDPEVVGLLSGVSANHAEWRSVQRLPCFRTWNLDITL